MTASDGTPSAVEESRYGPLALTVLGCDGSYPGPGGAGSGYLVTSGHTAVWLDAGPGSLANLQMHVPLEDLDAVVITHEHPDHWSDLEHLAVACKWVVPRPPVPVYSVFDPRPLMHSDSATEVLAWSRIGAGEQIAIGAMRFTFSRTDHPVETLAVRVDGDGRALGYSADSGPGWGLAELGEGLDLALCEATHLSDSEGTVPHMSARQAGRSGRDAGVGRLIITHLWPRLDKKAAVAEASEAFGRTVSLAAIGERYEA